MTKQLYKCVQYVYVSVYMSSKLKQPLAFMRKRSMSYQICSKKCRGLKVENQSEIQETRVITYNKTVCLLSHMDSIYTHMHICCLSYSQSLLTQDLQLFIINFSQIVLYILPVTTIVCYDRE